MLTQFPLKPAAASTIHGYQSNTFTKICTDMDISDLLGWLKMLTLFKLFLKHTYYVAASHVLH